MEMRPTIKNSSHGYVKPDGNPMTGGEWWSITALYKKFIPIDSLTDDEAVAAWLADKYGDEAVYVEAYITEGEDKTTNCYTFEVEEIFEPEGLFLATEECPLLTPETKQALWERLDNIAYDTDDYKPCE